MWHLCAKAGDRWSVYASFKERTGDYVEQVKAGIARAKESGNESRNAAAIVMQTFVCDKKYLARKDGGLVMRALRHFDEVGLSNSVCEALEEALGEGVEYFALAKDGENIAEYILGEFTVSI